MITRYLKPRDKQAMETDVRLRVLRRRAPGHSVNRESRNSSVKQ
jgi:hypothetical protein